MNWEGKVLNQALANFQGTPYGTLIDKIDLIQICYVFIDKYD